MGLCGTVGEDVPDIDAAGTERRGVLGRSATPFRCRFSTEEHDIGDRSEGNQIIGDGFDPVACRLSRCLAHPSVAEFCLTGELLDVRSVEFGGHLFVPIRPDVDDCRDLVDGEKPLLTISWTV